MHLVKPEKKLLINLLLARIISSYGIASASASGIAATWLDGGNTTCLFPISSKSLQPGDSIIIVKSTNKLILQLFCNIVSSFFGMRAQYHIKRALRLILNNFMKDIKSSKSVMGGVTVFLAGDIRQTLPVISRRTKANEVQACIKASNL